VYEPKVDVFGVYSPSLIFLDATSIHTITQYCGKVHHKFETADGNHAV
jgi:hypothetical protein